jgi:hypothetical protein
MSSEPPQRTSILPAQEMSGHVRQCRQDTSSNSVLETLSEGHSVDIMGICGHFMDVCGHLRTYLNFPACPDKLACPQGFLSFVLSEDMSRTCPGQMKLRGFVCCHKQIEVTVTMKKQLYPCHISLNHLFLPSGKLFAPNFFLA